MTTVSYAVVDRPVPARRVETVSHQTGGTFAVPPPTAPAGSAAPVSAAPARPAGPDFGRIGGRNAARPSGDRR